MDKMLTPWGHADHIEMVAEGVWFVSTPGHGGYRLSPERNAEVPVEGRRFAAAWSKGWFDGSAETVGWYEEDCAVWAVVKTFPDLFPEVTPEQAASGYARLFEDEEVSA